MTRYYLYIKAGLELDNSTRFYKLSIGESERQDRVRAWLEAYAFEHGHFFAIYDGYCVGFLDSCLHSVSKDWRDVLITRGDSFVASLRGNGDDPVMFSQALHRHRFLRKINPNYYALCQIARRNSLSDSSSI